MKTKTKKATKKARPTYAEVTEQLENLRRKVWLLQKKLNGQAADLEFLTACKVNCVESPEVRKLRANIFFNVANVDLAYVMQGEGA